MPLDEFQFLTRIHYLAPSDGMWGEHEIDYILFITAPVTVEPNPNEVGDVKWVDAAELTELMTELDRESVRDPGRCATIADASLALSIFFYALVQADRFAVPLSLVVQVVGASDGKAEK